MAGSRRRLPIPGGRPARPMPGPTLPVFFFWTFFLVSAAIGYLWIYNQTDVVAARLAEARQAVAVLENENRELQASIDNLARMERITRIARTRLQMHLPAAESMIVYLPEIPQ